MLAGASKFRELDAPVSAEAAVRLHKARIEALSCDVQALQTTVKQKSARISEADREIQLLQKDKVTWQKQMKQLETQVGHATVSSACQQCPALPCSEVQCPGLGLSFYCLLHYIDSLSQAAGCERQLPASDMPTCMQLRAGSLIGTAGERESDSG